MRQRPAVAAVGLALGALVITQCHDRGPTDVVDLLPHAETITEPDVRQRIALLADDSMRGRWTPSREIEETARYVESEFRRLGLRPALPNGSFIQRYPLPTDAGPDSSAVTSFTTAPNVIGFLEGSDARLSTQYVLLVAHMDHIGVRTPEQGDSIYNGADDNASGTAGVLELAEAFASMPRPPARSLIFLAVSGEERGFWGSRHYAEQPAAPLEKTVAALNFDMIARNSRDSVEVFGMTASSLGEIAARTAAAHPDLHMHLEAMPGSEQLLCCCSDHSQFAKRGVPVLFFHSGLHSDYHRPTDTVDRIDAAKTARILRMAFYVAAAIADEPARPSWTTTIRCTASEAATR